MKKLVLFLTLCLPLFAYADEGMWLINSLPTIYPQMKKEGLKLKADQLYSEYTPALAGAVVAVDGGTGTGSMISDQGLMITNHHVAYSDIHALSTPERNYLETGFWALERKDEIPIKDKSVSFLRKVVDVTAECKAIYDSIKQAGKIGIFTNMRIFGTIEKRYAAAENTTCELSCASFFKGELYLLFYYDVYKDVRLVGTPPVSIGAFGGETDNWGWPQHKCDFTLYRVYGKDDKPAEYSADNTPIKPVKFLNISTSGVKDGDYTMIIGFPYRTNRYKSSYAIRQKLQVTNPVAIKARREMLDVMLRHMEADPRVRLLYSDKYFGISNYADYAKWENICLRRYDVAAIREREEAGLQQWIDANPDRESLYGTSLLTDLKNGYEARRNLVRQRSYFQEDWIRSSELYSSASRIASVAKTMTRQDIKTVKAGDETLSSVISNCERVYSKIDPATERERFLKLAPRFAANVPDSMRGEAFNTMLDKFNGDATAMLTWAIDNSIIRSKEQITEFFATERTVDELLSDPMVALASAIPVTTFSAKEKAIDKQLGYDTNSRETTYARALYAMRTSKGQPQYPDANATMRLTYGTVGPIAPADAVQYASQTTIKGYMEKYDPDNYEFRVDPRLQSLIKAADWGQWGEKGQLYVNFLTNNDITGGNSGSPIMNANGNLIGLAFDGNRESMCGDVYYHPKYFKTVNVDIRFILWIMDKYANATPLIQEMTLVK